MTARKFTMDRRTLVASLFGAATLPAAAAAKLNANEAALPDTRIRHRTVTANGLSIFYREAGSPDAPVILLLHGWPASSHMFKGLMPLLADRYRLIAPDYPGFGHSECPPSDKFAYSFASLETTMEAFVQALKLDRFALYAHDFGGPVGYSLMLRSPHRVTALVLQNCPAYPEEGAGWWSTLAQYWKTGSIEDREKVRIYNDPASIKAQYLFGAPDPSLIDPDNWLIDSALMSRAGWQDISLDLLYDIRNNVPVFRAAREYFRSEKPPALIVSGKNDEIFSGKNQSEYLSDLPHAELRLQDSGHFALEDRAQEIAILMRDFLDRNVGAKSGGQ